MKVKNLREWLIRKEGEVSTAYNKTATIGELMQVVELLIVEEEQKSNHKGV